MKTCSKESHKDPKPLLKIINQMHFPQKNKILEILLVPAVQEKNNAAKTELLMLFYLVEKELYS